MSTPRSDARDLFTGLRAALARAGELRDAAELPPHARFVSPELELVGADDEQDPRPALPSGSDPASTRPVADVARSDVAFGVPSSV